MAKIIVFLFIPLFVLSCSRNKTGNEDRSLLLINIKVNDDDFDYDISPDILPGFDLILLETDKNSLLGGVNKIIPVNDKYYILDKKNNAIFIFSSSGSFLSCLDKRGQGPDEYVYIQDFAVIGENIWICDNKIKKLLCYDSDFNVVKSIRLKSHVFDMASLDNKILLAHNWFVPQSESSQLMVYDTQKETMLGLLPVPPLKNGSKHRSMEKQLAVNNNTCYFTYSYTDTIFQIKDDEAIPQYKLIFSERMNNMPEMSGEKYPSNTIWGITGIHQTLNSLIFEYTDKGYAKQAIYNKNDNTANDYSSLIIKDLGGMILYNWFFCDDYMFCWLNAFELQDYYHQYLKKELFERKADKEKLAKFIENLKSDDNPVIFRFKLREFSTL